MKKLILLLLLTSCSHKEVIRLSSEKLEGKKQLSLVSNSSGAWLYKLLAAIEKEGVSVKREGITGETTKHASNETFRHEQTASRYVLRVSADEIYNRRCFGGGHTFDSIALEIYDSQENKGIVMLTDSGYSEGCPPAISSMFEDFGKNIRNLWD